MFRLVRLYTTQTPVTALPGGTPPPPSRTVRRVRGMGSLLKLDADKSRPRLGKPMTVSSSTLAAIKTAFLKCDTTRRQDRLDEHHVGILCSSVCRCCTVHDRHTSESYFGWAWANACGRDANAHADKGIGSDARCVNNSRSNLSRLQRGLF